MEKRDTIVAVATAAGRGAIGIVRLSGSGLSALFPALLGGDAPPRRAVLRDFLDTQGSVIDTGLVLYFPGPCSYTGEDVLELQGHGGSAVLDLLVHRCVELGARLANPGEFTLRAFLNGRMDLAQAEAVADLIDASTAQAARSAGRSLRGEFSREISQLIERLTALRVRVEAEIDFPDEDIERTLTPWIAAEISGLQEQVQRIRAAAARGSLLRSGATVALYGPPNVGKSSLMNRLAGDDVSIVTEIPGTTRDAIRVQRALRGVPIEFVDTAGVREARDVVERLGIERTLSAVAGADLTLVMYESSQQRSSAALPASIGPHLHVANKTDLHGSPMEVDEDVVYISAKTGDGIERLCDRILTRIGWQQGEETSFSARQRHLFALDACKAHLDAAVQAGGAFELVAEELRQAQRALHEVGGDISSDALLGEIFGKFCIGK